MHVFKYSMYVWYGRGHTIEVKLTHMSADLLSGRFVFVVDLVASVK